LRCHPLGIDSREKLSAGAAEEGRRKKGEEKERDECERVPG